MTNTNSPPQTKQCSICGQDKPLSDYSQFATAHGPTYGAICAACRKIAREKLAGPKSDSDGGTTSITDHRIGTEEKVQSEIEKRQEHKQIEEEYEKEREKDEKISTDQIQKTDTRTKDEKKHRDSYLSTRTFLDNRDKIKSTEAEVFGGEDHRAEAERIDLTSPMVDTQIAGKEKHKGAVFNQFKAWLGSSAPIVGANVAGQSKPASQSSQKKSDASSKKEETLSEHVDNAFGPKSRGR